MLRNMKVGTKLIAVLIAPLVVLAVLAAIGINSRRADASEAKRVEELTELSARNASAIQALEREMNLAAARMGSGGQELIAEYDEQKAATDESLAEAQDTLESLDVSGETAEFSSAVDSASSRLSDLGTIRTGVEDNQFQVTEAINQYLRTIDSLMTVNRQAALAAENPELSNELKNFVVFGEGKMLVAEQQAFLSAVVESPEQRFFGAEWNGREPDGYPCQSTEGDECPSYDRFVAAGSDADAVILRWQTDATGEQKSLYRNAVATSEVRAADDLVNQAVISGSDNQPVGIDANAWLTAALSKLDALYAVETTDDNSLLVGVLDQAQDLRAEADRQAQLFIIVTLAAIVGSLVLALVVARAVARPLQQLTEAAETLSTERLPRLVEQLRNPAAEQVSMAQELTPIDIQSKDEIGQLADAFNSIQQVTVEVAEEQAQLLRKGIGDIFINLARRNQTLLDRQIEFIDQLEAHEEDPDQLDNLFKLDHLATRMRRNAESLLVLAGAEPPRRRGRPVALADVVRVAIGEVEDFARISLLALDDAEVGGNVAVDLAHLLSELMENATHFSPPDTHVEVVGHIMPNGGYTLQVTDQGIGMSSEQLAEANHQLEHPPLVGLALSRSLGFIVIGRLAQRFDIEVELTSSPSGGVTALVKLPRDLVTDDEGNPLPVDEEVAAALAAEAAAAEAAAAEEAALAEAAQAAAEAAAAEEPAEEVVSEEEVTALDADELEDGDEYEVVYEEVEVEVEVDEAGEPIEAVEEAALEEDEFERGLESLISGETPPGPIEAEPGMAPAEPEPEPEAEPEPVAEAEPEPEPDEGGEPEPAQVAASPDSGGESALAEPPSVTPPPAVGDITAAGLVKRTPKKRKNDAVGTGPLRTAATTQRPTGATKRSPEEVKNMLSRYRGGLKKGRTGPDSPDGDSDS